MLSKPYVKDSSDGIAIVASPRQGEEFASDDDDDESNSFASHGPELEVAPIEIKARFSANTYACP